MRRVETTLPDVCILEPDVFEDDRGYFFETYHQTKLAQLGISDVFVQQNQSGSRRNVLRGLHFQLHKPQAKICRVISGEVLDVAVDVRRGSPTFGKWLSVRLSAENRRQIYIPIGFAHGFRAISEFAEFHYLCSDLYDAADERGIRWDDPQLAIDWEQTEPPIISA